MDDEPVQLKRNKRLIEELNGSHIGGKLNKQVKDPIDDVKLNRRGMSIYD